MDGLGSCCTGGDDGRQWPLSKNWRLMAIGLSSGQRIIRAVAPGALPFGPRDGIAVYCCGPEPLLAAAEDRCSHWPAGSFHSERFAPKPVAPRQGEDHEIKVVLARSGLELTVPPDLSILDALKAAGVGPAFSCEEGTCGTCEAKILEGVADHRDSLLTEAERTAGKTMMICVSRALSCRLVLDL